MSGEEMLNATLVGRRDLNERYTILRIRPDRVPIDPFEPGQFINLGLPQPARPRPGTEDSPEPPRVRIAKRSYSIASSPRENDHYELFLTVVPEGRLTPELWRIREGGRCWIDSRALGAFTLERVPPGSDLVMVGTGTGISPYVSMLRTYGEEPRWRRLVLIHGVRYAADLGYRDELEERQRRDARFRYVPVVSREPEGSWSGLRGRVQVALEEGRFRELAGFALDPGQVHVFLCGNPDMVQSVREKLAPGGFVADTAQMPGNLHFEKYW